MNLKVNDIPIYILFVPYTSNTIITIHIEIKINWSKAYTFLVNYIPLCIHIMYINVIPSNYIVTD